MKERCFLYTALKKMSSSSSDDDYDESGDSSEAYWSEGSESTETSENKEPIATSFDVEKDVGQTETAPRIHPERTNTSSDDDYDESGDESSEGYWSDDPEPSKNTEASVKKPISKENISKRRHAKAAAVERTASQIAMKEKMEEVMRRNEEQERIMREQTTAIMHQTFDNMSKKDPEEVFKKYILGDRHFIVFLWSCVAFSMVSVYWLICD